MVVALRLTVKSHWAITEILQFAVFLKEKLDLWLFLNSGHSRLIVPSQVFWQKCLIEMPESVSMSFPLLGLLDLCQLAYHSFESLFWPIQGLLRPSLLPLCLSRLRGLGCEVFEVKYMLTCFIFCLLCIGDRSSTNRMVSLVVPYSTLIASFITLSSFCRFVCGIVLRPRPVSDTENHTLIQSESVALLHTFCSHSFTDWQAFLSHVWEWRETIPATCDKMKCVSPS